MPPKVSMIRVMRSLGSLERGKYVCAEKYEAGQHNEQFPSRHLAEAEHGIVSHTAVSEDLAHVRRDNLNQG
jgi:predicted transposase YbfD/YdcC